jgi:hypothetical protein
VAEPHIRKVVEQCAEEAGVELDDDTLAAVLTILSFCHLLNDPWARGFQGTPATWVARVRRVARTSLNAVVGSDPPEPRRDTL